MKAKELRFEEIEVGATVEFSHRITSEDLERFAAVSGDHNPLHMDESFAEASTFGLRVVHGMFLASLFSRLVGMELPGRDCLYLSQSLEFSRPAFINDEVKVRGEVLQKQDTTRTLVIKTEICHADGRKLVRGKAIVKVLA